MRFLIVGDVVGNSGMQIIKDNLQKIIKHKDIDVCIVNGENATGGRGLKEKEMKAIFASGADVITMGNHVYYRKEARELYVNEPHLIIPANITNLPGKGYTIINRNGTKIAVINLIGKVNMGEINNEFITNPFVSITEILDKVKEDKPKYIFVDFHAEATAEKRAMAYFLKDKVTCLYGTHTHVQTADEGILEGKIAFISDIGMTGPTDSVIGLKTEIALERFLTGEKIKYECSNSPGSLNSIIVETDDENSLPISIVRYNT